MPKRSIKHSLVRTVASLFLAAAFALAGTGAARADATDRAKKLIAAFKAVKTAPEGKTLSAADKKANLTAYKNLDGFFAYDQFGDACLGPARTTLAAKVSKDLKDRLVDILRRRGYANAGSLFNDGLLTHGAPKQSNGQTITPVAMKFPKQDLSMNLDFVWGKGDKVVDLIIDDDSLVADLSNQIGRVLKKSGADELGKKLQAKQAELEQEGL